MQGPGRGLWVLAPLTQGLTEGTTWNRAIERLAMISLHTSPLDQPGTGDAGGMNVYVVELARRLAAARHRGRHLHPRHLLRARRRSCEAADGVLVRHVARRARSRA